MFNLVKTRRLNFWGKLTIFQENELKYSIIKEGNLADSSKNILQPKVVHAYNIFVVKS